MLGLKLQSLYSLKNVRKDLHDILDEDIKSIKDRELLIIELKHTNDFLQSKEKTINTVIIMIVSGLGILLYNLIKSIVTFFEFSKNITTEDLEYLKLNLPIFFNTSIYILFIFAGLFVYIVIIDLFSRYKIIKRKNLILHELKKTSRYRYNKTE